MICPACLICFGMSSVAASRATSKSRAGEMSHFWGRAWGGQATFSLIWSCLPRDNRAAV